MSFVWQIRLAERAELDFLDIAAWTAENFGAHQAEYYAETVTLAIEALHDGPEILGAKARDNIAVIRGQYIYLGGVLLADSRRIVARGRRGREDFHLTVSSNRYSVMPRVRDGVRRHFAGAPRHRQRSTDRYALSLRRYRLRGVVLSQGCEGADPHRRRCGHRPARADSGCSLRLRRRTILRSGCWSTDKVAACFSDDLQGRPFALWGLAFKPDTDDMPEAPSRVIVHELLHRGAAIQAYDPVATAATFSTRPWSAASGSSITPSGAAKRFAGWGWQGVEGGGRGWDVRACH
jgi:plasmid stabilization system protein ParE